MLLLLRLLLLHCCVLLLLLLDWEFRRRCAVKRCAICSELVAFAELLQLLLQWLRQLLNGLSVLGCRSCCGEPGEVLHDVVDGCCCCRVLCGCFLLLLRGRLLLLQCCGLQRGPRLLVESCCCKRDGICVGCRR